MCYELSHRCAPGKPGLLMGARRWGCGQMGKLRLRGLNDPPVAKMWWGEGCPCVLSLPVSVPPARLSGAPAPAHPESLPEHAVECEVILPGALGLLDVAQGGEGFLECAPVCLAVLQAEHGIRLQLLLLLVLCSGRPEGNRALRLLLRLRAGLRARPLRSPVVSTCSLSAMSQRSSLRWAPLTIT